MKRLLQQMVLVSLSVIPAIAVLAASAPPRAGLFFEEVWQQVPGGGENPMSQAHVANADLEVHVYGQKGEEGMQMNGIAVGQPGYDANPLHTWTGVCGAGCTFALKHRDAFADFSEGARIMVQSKTSGFHKLHPFIKLADGSAYVGDYEFGQTRDFLFQEFRIEEVNWMAFDAELGVTKGRIVPDLDLSKVDEIGFTDLQPGSGHGDGGYADVAVIRVYANAVKR